MAPYPESVNYTLYYYNEALYYTTKPGNLIKPCKALDAGLVLANKYHQTQLYQQFFLGSTKSITGKKIMPGHVKFCSILLRKAPLLPTLTTGPKFMES